ALPGMEIETRFARSVLPEQIALKDAASNWANAAALVAAVAQGKTADFGRAVVDRVVEPVRSKLIPGFAEVKRSALEAGARGGALRGRGRGRLRAGPRGGGGAGAGGEARPFPGPGSAEPPLHLPARHPRRPPARLKPMALPVSTLRCIGCGKDYPLDAIRH